MPVVKPINCYVNDWQRKYITLITIAVLRHSNNWQTCTTYHISLSYLQYLHNKKLDIKHSILSVSASSIFKFYFASHFFCPMPYQAISTSQLYSSHLKTSNMKKYNIDYEWLEWKDNTSILKLTMIEKQRKYWEKT